MPTVVRCGSPRLLVALALFFLQHAALTLGRAWTPTDLLVDTTSLSNFFFSERCHKAYWWSTTCNPDELLARTEAAAVDRLILRIADGVGEYALPGLDGGGFDVPRGRFVAVFLLREAQAGDLRLFTQQAYEEWVRRRCGTPRRHGCSNSVVLAVATGSTKDVDVYAGNSTEAEAMADSLADVEARMKAELGIWRENILSRYVLLPASLPKCMCVSACGSAGMQFVQRNEFLTARPF